MPTADSKIRFTVDLPLDLHYEFTALAERQGTSKAELLRLAIAQLSLETVVSSIAITGATKRFTVDIPLPLHEEFSILAIRLRASKADLVRMAIARLVRDVKRGRSS